MRTIEYEKENHDVQKAYQEDSEAYIFQAVWFKKPHGAKRYRTYLNSASPIAERYGAKRVMGLIPKEILQGNLNPDYICVLKWPSIEHYYRFLKDPEYQSITLLREEAVEKVVLIQCHRIG